MCPVSKMETQVFTSSPVASPKGMMVDGSSDFRCSHDAKCSKLSARKVPKRPDIWMMAIMGILLLLLVALTFGVIAVAIRLMKDTKVTKQDVLTNAVDGNPLRVQPHYEHLPIAAMNEIPIEMIEKMESLKLQWGKTGSGKEVKYYFQVLFAKQDKATKETVLGLSAGHQMVVSATKATLTGPEGEEIGVIYFSPPQDEEGDVTQLLQRVDPESTRVIRHEPEAGVARTTRNLLGKSDYGRYPYNVDLGLPESFFDAYCRYGCGGMAVTFPYYYRPFFGYGFPLVGTEAMFPQGYGGYPAAELLASQGSTSMIQGISSPGLPAAANGASTGNGGAAAPLNGGETVPMAFPMPQ